MIFYKVCMKGKILDLKTKLRGLVRESEVFAFKDRALFLDVFKGLFFMSLVTLFKIGTFEYRRPHFLIYRCNFSNITT